MAIGAGVRRRPCSSQEMPARQSTDISGEAANVVDNIAPSRPPRCTPRGHLPAVRETATTNPRPSHESPCCETAERERTAGITIGSENFSDDQATAPKRSGRRSGAVTGGCMSVVGVAGLPGFRSGSPVTAGWVSCSMMGRVRLVVSRLRRYRHRPRLALPSYGPAVTGPVS